MSYDTEERLKSYLDTNQLAREQLCRAVLAMDKRFSDVRPRHPRGGKDGGRDMQALHTDQLVFGAVGFVNQANDSKEQKRAITSKFGKDLIEALRASPKPTWFVFFTNVSLTLGEKDLLVQRAHKMEVEYCEIYDRERLRIELDSPDGFWLRYQFLALPLSDAEQASFFARWGGELQSLISTGFQSVHSTLEHMLFLQESSDVLSDLGVILELDRVYTSKELGHLRAFCQIMLREPKHHIWLILFGTFDRPGQANHPRTTSKEFSGIEYGLGGLQWEKPWTTDEDTESDEYVPAGSSSSNGGASADVVSLHYSHDHPLVRYQPRMALRDLDEAMFVFLMNESLATKLRGIHIYANGYKLKDVDVAQLVVDRKNVTVDIPLTFDPHELLDPWVCVRPRGATFFKFLFSEETPKRLYKSVITQDTLQARRIQTKAAETAGRSREPLASTPKLQTKTPKPRTARKRD